IMFGNPETTPGGMALKFYASVRIDVRKIETIKKGDAVVGTRHRAKVVKNKIAPPFKIAEFVINADGIDREEGLIDAALTYEILTKSGSFIRMGEKILAQGRDQLKTMIEKDTKLRQNLTSQIEKKMAAVPKKE
ncbi:DNA recombination/repair protein RecA, partial [Candidatus Roizmanbacteria bacterium]|nr:DNA recombination/repair protein RecA [Candidatus Roizmanbacteria bacterium]